MLPQNGGHKVVIGFEKNTPKEWPQGLRDEA
jgi:hypothetical protein